ncbi:hypothetical protein SAMN03159406_04235 [Rhizobium sp. NFR03]|nr:hypothetical protein SAMN03159406_04235 [Rhizobium sp. NFR03]
MRRGETRISGEVSFVSVEADNLMMCDGIQAILAVIFLDHLSGPQHFVWQREQFSWMHFREFV